MKFASTHFVLTGICVVALSGCGQQKTASSTLEKLSDDCTSSALSKQYIVRHMSGSVEVVQAESEADFVKGYLTQNLASVDYAEHDIIVHTALPVHAQSVDNQTNFADNWGVSRIDADKLWSQNVRGAGVLVAVVDTGADIQHTQLRDQIYTNPGESGVDGKGHDKSNNGLDDDANGFVDDIHGWDFVANAPLIGDNAEHGTHVSGIIAAAHQDTTAKPGNYVQGVAPGVKVLPLAFLDGTGAGTLSNGVMAIQYAVAKGAKVINASWGGTQCSRTLRDEIASLASKNIAFIAAAGNESQDVDSLPEYPASLNLQSQITVGAVGDHDYMANYSNYGAHAVHIFAPGTNITSTLPGGVMGFLSGTSMATPFVSGSVALLMGAMPTATVAQIRAALYNSALHDSQYINASQGRIDLAQALAELHRVVGQ